MKKLSKFSYREEEAFYEHLTVLVTELFKEDHVSYVQMAKILSLLKMTEQ
jgi:hypothetical protein